MSLYKIYRTCDSETEEPWGGYDFKKASLAVIAFGWRGSGVVMWAVGGHIRMELEETGLAYDDLGLTPPTPGIWIWEGKGEWIPGSYECPEDGCYELEGTWRRPNYEEWTRIQCGECPWNDEDWKLKPVSSD